MAKSVKKKQKIFTHAKVPTRATTTVRVCGSRKREPVSDCWSKITCPDCINLMISTLKYNRDKKPGRPPKPRPIRSEPDWMKYGA
jgi:hypothetical protein